MRARPASINARDGHAKILHGAGRHSAGPDLRRLRGRQPAFGDGVVRSVQFRPIRRSAVTLPLFVVHHRGGDRRRGGGRHARPGSGSATGAAPRASTRPMRGRRGRNWPICAPPRRPRAAIRSAFRRRRRAASTGPAGETSRARRCRTRPVSPVSRPCVAAPTALRPCPCSSKFAACPRARRSTSRCEAGADMVGFVFFPPSPRHLVARDGARARPPGERPRRQGRADGRCRRRARSPTSSRRCSRTSCNCTARKPWRGCATSSRNSACRS